MPDDPRNRPDPPHQPDSAAPLQDPRNRSAESAPATGTPGSNEPEIPVQPRNRPVLILPVRTLPPGAEPVNLAGLLARLRQDRATQVRAIGREEDPEALAATLNEEQIRRLTEELVGQVRVVDDTPIEF